MRGGWLQEWGEWMELGHEAGSTQCVCRARGRKSKSGVGVSLVLMVKIITGPVS